MEFRITRETPEKVVLAASPTNRVVGIVFSVLALIALPVGILAILAAPRDSIGHAIAGFGLFFWGASRAASRARIVQPSELVFDNQQGVLRFMQRLGRKNAEQATASFAEIAGFITVPRQDDRMTRFCTALEWRDGSLLILHSHAAEKDARDETLKMQTGIRLNTHSPPATPALPATVRRQSTAGATVFSWQFGFLSRHNLTALLAIAGFLYAMLAIVSASDTVGATLILVFAAIIAGVIGYFALRWAGAEANLEIGDSEIRYFEKRGLRRKLKHSMPLQQLDRALLTTLGPGGDAIIYLLKKDEYTELRKIDLGETGLTGVAAALGFLFSVFKVYTPTLNYSERLCLVWLIRSAARERLRGDSALPDM